MAAAFWYLRAIKRSELPRWRQAKGAGWVRPAVLICECGASHTFEVLVSCGTACVRCKKELLPEESLDAALAAITLGGSWDAALTDMAGIPNVDSAEDKE